MSKQKVKGTFAETHVLRFIARNWYGVDETLKDADKAEPQIIGYSLRYPSAVSELFPLQMTHDEYVARPDAKDSLLASLYQPVFATTADDEIDYSAEGVPWRRIASLGGKDTGDIDGPFTIIEVKNYTNPPMSGLLSNAEWKSGNTTKPLWLLVYKAAGKGAKSVGDWHVMMTVGALFDRYGVRPQEQPGSSAEECIAAVDAWCRSEDTLEALFSAPMKGRSFPEQMWTPRLHFSNMKAKVPERRETMWKTASIPFNETDRILPLIISPRRDCTPDRWFVYTKLAVACRMLEVVGVLPTIGVKTAV